MPRSGTSLVEHILSCHPLVHGAGELEDIGNITNTLMKKTSGLSSYPECVDLVAANTLNEIADSYLDKLQLLGGNAVRIIDKMPHNFQALGLIELLFPQARIIHCTRDPLDNCLSIYFLHFNAKHAYSYDLHNLGIYYMQYQRLMEHWINNLQMPILEVKYEEIVEDFERKSRDLIDFIGLAWDDACLHFHTSDRVVATPSYDQVRRSIYRSSIHRWKHYESHLDALKKSLQ